MLPGDLWSYDYFSEKFVVSPEPDVAVHKLDPQRHKCLVLASDGLWNMLKAEESVAIVSELEMHFEDRVVNDEVCKMNNALWTSVTCSDSSVYNSKDTYCL